MSTYADLLNEYNKLKEDYDEHKKIATEYEKELEDTNKDYEVRNSELITLNDKLMKEISKLKEDYLQYKEKNIEKMKEIEFLENQAEKYKSSLEQVRVEKLNFEKKIILLENENNDYLNKARELECWAEELKNKLDAALEENIILHNENEATKCDMEEAIQRLQQELEESKNEITSKEKIINRMTMHRDFLLKTAYNVQDDLENNIIPNKSLQSLRNSSSGKLNAGNLGNLGNVGNINSIVNKNLKIPEKFMQTYSKSFLSIDGDENNNENLQNIQKSDNLDEKNLNQNLEKNDSCNGIALNTLNENEDNSINTSHLEEGNGLNINLNITSTRKNTLTNKNENERENMNLSPYDKDKDTLNSQNTLNTINEANTTSNNNLRYKKLNSIDETNPDGDITLNNDNNLLNTTGIFEGRSKKISVSGLEKFLKTDLKGSIVLNEGENLNMGNEDDEEREFIRQRIDMEIKTILDTRMNFLLNTLTQENFSFDLLNQNHNHNDKQRSLHVNGKIIDSNCQIVNKNVNTGKIIDNIDEMLAKIQARKEKVMLQKKAMQSKLERVGIKIC